VHARAERSPSDAQWHNNFDLLTSSLFRCELEATGEATDSLDAEVMIGVFTMEGLLMHPMPEDEQRAICDTLAARWIPKPPPSNTRDPQAAPPPPRHRKRIDHEWSN
jgi:TetR/AcrR family transcriptional regulator, cholesterol catabolism regulator